MILQKTYPQADRPPTNADAEQFFNWAIDLFYGPKHRWWILLAMVVALFVAWRFGFIGREDDSGADDKDDDDLGEQKRAA